MRLRREKTLFCCLTVFLFAVATAWVMPGEGTFERVLVAEPTLLVMTGFLCVPFIRDCKVRAAAFARGPPEPVRKVVSKIEKSVCVKFFIFESC